MAIHYIDAPLNEKTVALLRAGDQVLLSGVIYTARDAAHKRFVSLIEQGLELPVDLRNQVIYYAGPCPPKPGKVVGPNAPTTAYRMDSFAPAMFKYGVKATIGKGPRTEPVKQACIEHKAIHLSAIGGMSTLLAKKVKKVEVVAYEDLKTEAIRAFTIEDFPVLVTYDIYGGDMYEQEIKKYRNYTG